MGSDKIWLYVIGMGEEGILDLSKKAKEAIYKADIFYVGVRHFEHLYEFDEKLKDIEHYFWHKPFLDNIHKIKGFKKAGKKVVVLASGNPLFYGAGSILADHISKDEMCIIPFSSSIDLACARLCWQLNEVSVVTVHGRPIENIISYLAPRQRILVLCNDGKSPFEIAAILVKYGYGESELSALSHIGGKDEEIYSKRADEWGQHKCPDLTILAIETPAAVNADISSHMCGLDDDLFESDGNFTKREVRAISISSLRPSKGQILWDIGAGSGTISVEWMRSAENTKAIAIEKNEKRVEFIKANAIKLGAPKIKVMQGAAPQIFSEIDEFPDAIFIGGGLLNDEILEKSEAMLLKGGRIVANAVSIKGCNKLYEAQAKYGGEIVKIAIERLEKIAGGKIFKPNITVTHWRYIKS